MGKEACVTQAPPPGPETHWLPFWLPSAQASGAAPYLQSPSHPFPSSLEPTGFLLPHFHISMLWGLLCSVLLGISEALSGELGRVDALPSGIFSHLRQQAWTHHDTFL